MNSSNPEISPSIGGMNNTYICVATQDQDTPVFRCLLDNYVYGWTSVYENNRASVIAIQHENYLGDFQIGTAFYLFGNFIVTARHCIKSANSLALQSVSFKILNECRIVISKNEALDLALIEGGDFPLHNSLPIMLDTGSVLDEILVLGYPNIPGYHPTLTAEKALVSARLTAMNGAIASSRSLKKV